MASSQSDLELQTQLRRELASTRQTTAAMQRGLNDSRNRPKSVSPTEGVDQTVLSRLSNELAQGENGPRASSQNSFQELDLLAEEQLWRQKTEKSTRQNIGDVTELKSRLDNQLKDAYRDMATYRAQAEQLTADLRAERARREKVERDLSSVQDSANQLSSDLAEARLENGHLANLSTQSGGSPSLMQELAEARQQAERAIRARDRAQDQVAELEEACAELEKLAAPATKETEIRDQMKLMTEQKVSMMEKMIKEESRNYDAAVSKMEALEAERDDAIVQVQRLQSLIKELRSDTNRASRVSRRSSTASNYGEDRWAGRSAYATEALVQAALRMTQIETENERLRQQLQSRHEASKAADEDKQVIQGLRIKLQYAEDRYEEMEAALEAQAPAFADDHQMYQILRTKQKQMTEMQSVATELADFAKVIVDGNSNQYHTEAGDLITAHNECGTRNNELPEGWEVAYTETDHVEYYINHTTQTTQWVHPNFQEDYTQHYASDEIVTKVEVRMGMPGNEQSPQSSKAMYKQSPQRATGAKYGIEQPPSNHGVTKKKFERFQSSSRSKGEFDSLNN